MGLSRHIRRLERVAAGYAAGNVAMREQRVLHESVLAEIRESAQKRQQLGNPETPAPPGGRAG